MDNLVLVCRRHHRLVHEEGYGIKATADGEITFTLPDGWILPNNQHGRFRGNVIALKARNRESGLDINSFTAVPTLYDPRMDLNEAVSALAQRE